MANLNINEFQQSTIRGVTDLQVTKSGVLTCKISSNQATALVAGAFVKLDAAITTPGTVPQVVAAAVGDVALGAIIFSVKQDSFATGDEVQIALNNVIVYLVAGATIVPGALVEDHGDGTVITKSANIQRGIALDYATSGNLLRVLLSNVTLVS